MLRRVPLAAVAARVRALQRRVALGRIRGLLVDGRDYGRTRRRCAHDGRAGKIERQDREQCPDENGSRQKDSCWRVSDETCTLTTS